MAIRRSFFNFFNITAWICIIATQIFLYNNALDIAFMFVLFSIASSIGLTVGYIGIKADTEYELSKLRVI